MGCSRSDSKPGADADIRDLPVPQRRPSLRSRLGEHQRERSLSRALAVCESGIGFGFLAIVIGYLPVIYGAFSRREVSISLLDARAGSPPSALELLRRHGEDGGLLELHRLLLEWERWCAELLESHLSYPVLCFYRSQHSNQSWLATLTTILDTCSLIIVGIEGTSARQARLTFAMARHAVVDLAQVIGQAPLINDPPERLTVLIWHCCG